MDTQNSQKRSPRSSAKSKHDTTRAPEPQRGFDGLDEEEYLDRSIDHVARVRAAREAAQREMETFGDVSEYDITIIQGQLKEESTAASQPSLDFRGGSPANTEKEEA